MRWEGVSQVAVGTVCVTCLGCGPSSHEPSGVDDDHASDSSTSTGGRATTTGFEPGCGNGVVEEGEWCHEQYLLDDILPDAKELFRVAHGTTRGPDVFILWSLLGFHSIAFEPEQTPAFTIRQFYEVPGGYDPGSRLFAARFSLPEDSGLDFFHWEPEPTNVGAPSSGSQNVWLVPGPDRVDEPSGFVLELAGLNQARDAFLVPIDVDDNGTDEYFAVDPTSGLGALYHYNPTSTEPPSPDWKPFESGAVLGLRKPIDAITDCVIRAAEGGDLNLDGLDEAVVLADTCPAESDAAAEMVVFEADGQGTLDPDPAFLRPGPSGLSGSSTSTPMERRTSHSPEMGFSMSA